jgi:BirA family transcriptional regulator, biotin operon repressor / biotin---[acetyl-CoA-carboxylase] ligase
VVAYSIEEIHAQLSTSLVGQRIELHEQVGSTNDLAREAGKAGAPEGLVILAEEQVRGKGRLGRTWTAPPGSSILCSVLLRPRFSPRQGFYLTIAASLAILRVIREIYPRHAPYSAIKWPNDVLVNGRKVAGVLGEGEFVGGEWGFAVVGFGINVSLSGAELEGLRSVAPKATSLSVESGVDIDRITLLARVLEELERLYLTLQNGEFNTVYEEWIGKMETVGRRVLVDQGGHRVDGVAVRVDTDGALVIRTDDWQEHRILAGDVI